MAGRRIAYIVLGFAMTFLGIIGIFIPGLPSTVFILIALWAFSRSSAKLHQWLTKLPILRQTIQEIDVYQKQKDLPISTKIISQTAAWLSCIICTIIFQSLALTIVLLVAAVACSVFMYMTPTRAHSSNEEAELLDV